MTLTNLTLTEDIEIEGTFIDKQINSVCAEIIKGELSDNNMFSQPDTVHMEEFQGEIVNGLKFTLYAYRVLHLELEI